jgi:hypothetical protein
VMQQTDFFITFVDSRFTVHSYVPRNFIAFSRNWQFTGDFSIVFIAMGTRYFNQNEGFSLSFPISYYLFAVSTISVFNFRYVPFLSDSITFCSRTLLSLLSLYLSRHNSNHDKIRRNVKLHLSASMFYWVVIYHISEEDDFVLTKLIKLQQ